MNININNILKVYNGKVGCMCGCLGKYSVPTCNREAADKDRGYAYTDDDVSDRSVKIIAKKVLSNPNVKFEDRWAYVEDRAADKNQVVYFVDEAAMLEAKAAIIG